MSTDHPAPPPTGLLQPLRPDTPQLCPPCGALRPARHTHQPAVPGGCCHRCCRCTGRCHQGKRCCWLSRIRLLAAVGETAPLQLCVCVLTTSSPHLQAAVKTHTHTHTIPPPPQGARAAAHPPASCQGPPRLPTLPATHAFPPPVPLHSRWCCWWGPASARRLSGPPLPHPLTPPPL